MRCVPQGPTCFDPFSPDWPGERTSPHRHTDKELEGGSINWLTAQEHSGENIGSSETRVLFVEWKPRSTA